MTLIESRDHWLALAKSERALAKHWEDNGLPYGDVSSYYNRARSYERTAEALTREIETGKPHCSLCLGDHPNHLHAHRG